MANTEKPKRPSAARERKRPTAPASQPAPVSPETGCGLTPDGVRRQWEISHPERPEIRASLERLYRQSR